MNLRSFSWKYLSKHLQINFFADSIDIFDKDCDNLNSEGCGIEMKFIGK